MRDGEMNGGWAALWVVEEAYSRRETGEINLPDYHSDDMEA